MNYLRKNNHRRLWSVVIAIAVLVCVFAVIGVFFRGPLSSVVQSILGPGTWLRGYEQSSVVFIHSLFTSKYSLQKRVATLEKENSTLKDQLAFIEDERMLEGLAALGNASGTPRIMAHVMMRPPYSPYDSLTISKGNVDGIILGHKVFPLDRLIPIGIVTDVTAHTATITLFSSSGQHIPVMVGTSTEEWTADGRGGGMFEVRIPQSHKVAKGDKVIMARESPLPFAVVDEIVSSPSDPFQTVRFLLPVSFGSLSIVGIAERP